MELERLAVALRPRNSWEAIDLGLRLAVLHARALYGAWFAVTLPVAAVLLGLFSLGEGLLGWATLIMWWLKPAFDRVALFVISRVVFGQAPTPREALRALPGLLHAGGLLRGLTLSRLSPYRAVTLPVDVLEGLRGKARRQRKALVVRRISGAATWLTLGWVHLEWLLWMGVLGLLPLVVPREFLRDLDWSVLLGDGVSTAWLAWTLAILPLAASLIMEPLYVAAGFMLYIKRRTDLEAWDVELEFRRLAKRVHPGSASSALAALALAICLAAAVLAPEPAYADNASLRDQRVGQAEATAKAVLEDPVFGHADKKRSLHWRPLASKQQRAEDLALPAWLRGLFDHLGGSVEWLANAFATIGRVGGWLLILLAAGAILFLVARFRFSREGGHTRYIPPAELAGFDIRPQSLPDDVAAAAQALLQEGNARAALSLLFRGTLSRLAHQEQVPFGRGDTEGDCLTRVRKHAPGRSGFTTRLLGCWQRLAYAHQRIDAAEVETLCQDWQREFGQTGARP